jgi:hypothetical protein
MGWVGFLLEEGFDDVGLDTDIVHDIERVEGLVSGVGVLLEHDDRHAFEVFGFLGIKVMAGDDHGEVLREITEVDLNTVLEHVFGGLGAVDFVKGGEVPILDLDVVQDVFKLGGSKLFAQLFGAKEVECEEFLQEFSTCGEILCIAFSKVLCEKVWSFGDRDFGKDFAQR